MMSLINGAFDLVKVIDAAVKSPTPFFSGSMGSWYNVTQAIVLLIPISALLAAPFAYYLYKDHTESESASLTGSYQPTYQRSSDRYSGGQTSQAANFNAFSGQGQR